MPPTPFSMQAAFIITPRGAAKLVVFADFNGKKHFETKNRV